MHLVFRSLDLYRISCCKIYLVCKRHEHDHHAEHSNRDIGTVTSKIMEDSR